MKWFSILWVSMAVSVAAQEDLQLDPSIFDGTGMNLPEAEGTPQPEDGAEDPSGDPGEKESPGAGAEEAPPSTDAESPLPAEERPAPPVPGSSEKEEEGMAGLPETEDPVDAEDTGGMPGGGEEEPETESVQETSGMPAPAGSSGRAGEQVETKDRVAPGQAVDLPWDI